MIDPLKVPVEVVSGIDVKDQILSIRRFNGCFAMGVLGLPEGVANIVAKSESARALVYWALDRGAKQVRSDYDLKFER